ncbi:MAG: hypothetical protein WA705_29350 [Candidatus Ozemobacteraceae bacterium]
MKPFVLRPIQLLAVVLCLTFAMPLVAYDYGKLLPDNLLILMKVRLGQDLTCVDPAAPFPELEKTFADMDARIEKEIGMLPQRDLHEVGFYATDEFDFSGTKIKPKNAVVFVLGVFKPELLVPKLVELLPKLNPRQPISVNIEEFQGKQLLAFPRGRAFFRDAETFLAGRGETIRALAAPTSVQVAASDAFKLSAEIIKPMAEANFFFHLNISRALKVILAKLPSLRIPMFIQDWSQRIQTLTLFENGDVLNIMIGYDTPETANVFKTNLDGLMGMASLFVENRDRSLDARIASGTLLQIIGEFKSQKIIIAVIRRVIKHFSFEITGNQLVIKMTIPKQFKGKLSPLTLTAAAGIVGAIALPKIAKMQKDSQRQACLAVQARIAQAIEMYNHEQKEPLKTLDDADLRAGGKLAPFMGGPLEPTEGCRYVTTDELGKGGKIACMRHGSGN